jgi:hypothetical protein
MPHATLPLIDWLLYAAQGLVVIDDVAYFGVSEWGNREARQTSNSQLAAFDLIDRKLLWQRNLETRGLLNVVAAPHLAQSSTYQSIATHQPNTPLQGGFFTTVDFDTISPTIIPKARPNGEPRAWHWLPKKPVQFIDEHFAPPPPIDDASKATTTTTTTNNNQQDIQMCVDRYKADWNKIRKLGLDYVLLKKGVFYKLPLLFDAERLRTELSKVIIRSIDRSSSSSSSPRVCVVSC